MKKDTDLLDLGRVVEQTKGDSGRWRDVLANRPHTFLP